MKKTWVLSCPLRPQQSLQSDWEDTTADPSSLAKGTKSTSSLRVRKEVDLVPLACEDPADLSLRFEHSFCWGFFYVIALK